MSGGELTGKLEAKNLTQTAEDVLNKTLERIQKDAEQWGEKTKTMIAAAYGDGEALLFLNDSGYQFYGDNSQRGRVKIWIDGRMRRMRCPSEKSLIRNNLTKPTSLCFASVAHAARLRRRRHRARLGHASITMTADRYGHLFPRSDDGAELAAAERAFLRS